MMRIMIKIGILVTVMAMLLLPALTVGAEETAGAESLPEGMVRLTAFVLPEPEGYEVTDQGQKASGNGQLDWITWQEKETGNQVYAQATSYKKVFSTRPEEAKALYEKQLESVEHVLWQQDLDLDGNHPSSVVAASYTRPAGEDGAEKNGVLVYLHYFYGSSSLELIYDLAGAETAEADVFLSRFSRVSYSVTEDRAGLPSWLVTPECFVMTLSTKDDVNVLAAGKSLAVKATLAGEQRVRSMDASAVRPVWVLLDAETLMRDGSWVPMDKAVASIDQNGNIRAGNVEKATAVTVLAHNLTAGYTASMNVLLLPKQTSFALSEKKAELYAMESAPLEIRVNAEPAETLLITENYSNLTWKLSREDLATLAVRNDGSALLIPMAAGNLTLTVKDTVSGRQAQMTVRFPDDKTPHKIPFDFASSSKPRSHG